MPARCTRSISRIDFFLCRGLYSPADGVKWMYRAGRAKKRIGVSKMLAKKIGYKWLIFILCVLMACPSAMAEGKSLDEIVDLYGQAQREKWHAVGWESVIVPWGLWKVGTDLPAGEWIIETAGETSIDIAYTCVLEKGEAKPQKGSSLVEEHIVSPNSVAHQWNGKKTKCQITLKKGAYLYIKYGGARLTPVKSPSKYKFSADSVKAVKGMDYQALCDLCGQLRAEAPKTGGWREMEIKEGEAHQFTADESIRWEVTGKAALTFGKKLEKKKGQWTIPIESEYFFGVVNEPKKGEESLTSMSMFAICPPEGSYVVITGSGTAKLTSYIGQPDVIFE